jgi:mannosyltransferase OCH1-like enzyme
MEVSLMLVPKYIFQTTADKTALPSHILSNIHRLKTLNPDWSYFLFDDKDCTSFIKTHYDSTILNAYMRINPVYGAAKADFFRYLLIYAVGGVYLDVKSTAAMPLDQILLPDDHYILASWENGKGDLYEGFGLFPELPPERGEFQTWHIIARPRHPFLERVILGVKHNIDHYSISDFGVGKMGVLRTTGPIAYTLAIQQIVADFPHRVIPRGDNGLRYSILADGKNGIYAHRSLFKAHYTQSREPVILPNTILTI